MSTIQSLDAPARRRATSPAARSAALAQTLARLRRTMRELSAVAPDVAAGQSAATFDLKFALTLERSRRCERPFALSRFSDATGSGGRAWAQRFVEEAERHIRTCDAVGLVDGCAVVVWDDSDRPGACVAAKRLAEAVGDAGTLAAVAATVVFPDDGYTPAALVQALDESARGTPR